jgi:hypothetical protein
MDLHDIDGYRLRRPLGSGTVGTVWLARDLTSGRPVVVKRVPAASVPRAESFRRDLALARGLGHRHAVRLLEVRQVSREWLLVSEYVGAGSLLDLLRRRGPLSTGELVTLLSPLAQVLAAAHLRGLCHGHLGTGDALLTADGRPLLADLGLRLTAGDQGSPGGDLAALGALARAAGGDPAVFTEDLFSGDGTTVAARVLDVAEPEPIGLGFGNEAAGFEERPERSTGYPDTGSTDGRELDAPEPDAPEPDGRDRAVDLAQPGATSRRRQRVTGADPWGRVGSHTAPDLLPERSTRRRQVRLLAGLAIAVVAAGTLLGLGITVLRPGDGVTQRGRHAAVPVPSPPPASTGERPGSLPPQRPVQAWLATLTALDARRAQAFARLDPAALDAVYQRGSRPWSADRALLASYQERRVRVHGLRIQVRSVEVEQPYGDAVVLRVVDRFAGATAVDTAGRRITLPAGPVTTRLITMTGGAGRWRISSIVQG